MRKLGVDRSNDGKLGEWRRRRTRLRTCLALALAVLLASAAYETLIVCAAHWRAMWGQVETVETPVLDAFVDAYEGLAVPVRGQVAHTFHDMPWRPSLVIGLAVAWALAGSRLMRRT